MLLAQITDTHVVGSGRRIYGDEIDSNALMRRAVDRLNALVPRPDCVVITGDLTDDGSPDSYAELRGQLDRIAMPFFLAIGNHDDHQTMIGTLDYPFLSECRTYVQYAINDYPVRLLVLDSASRRHHNGEYCAERLAWLVERLAEAPGRPTIIALHHPPFATGIALMDAQGTDWAEGLRHVLAGYPNIIRIICGHIHRPIQTTVSGIIASSCPSTAHQVCFDIAETPYVDAFFEMEPPALQLYHWKNEALTSHTVSINEFPKVVPLTMHKRAELANILASDNIIKPSVTL